MKGSGEISVGGVLYTKLSSGELRSLMSGNSMLEADPEFCAAFEAVLKAEVNFSLEMVGSVSFIYLLSRNHPLQN